VASAKHEFLYILFAKLLWKKMSKSEEALAVLRDGLSEHNYAEDIVIALQKLLRELGRFDEAQDVLDQAMERNATERVQM